MDALTLRDARNFLTFKTAPKITAKARGTKGNHKSIGHSQPVLFLCANIPAKGDETNHDVPFYDPQR